MTISEAVPGKDDRTGLRILTLVAADAELLNLSIWWVTPDFNLALCSKACLPGLKLFSLIYIQWKVKSSPGRPASRRLQ